MVRSAEYCLFRQEKRDLLQRCDSWLDQEKFQVGLVKLVCTLASGGLFYYQLADKWFSPNLHDVSETLLMTKQCAAEAESWRGRQKFKKGTKCFTPAPSGQSVFGISERLPLRLREDLFNREKMGSRNAIAEEGGIMRPNFERWKKEREKGVHVSSTFIGKLGEGGARFGDCLHMNYDYFPWGSGSEVSQHKIHQT